MEAEMKLCITQVATASQRETAGPATQDISGLCIALEDKERTSISSSLSPPVSHWSKSGPLGVNSSLPAFITRAFQTFTGEATWHTLDHGRLVGGIKASGGPSGQDRLLELVCLHPVVTQESFQMPALTPGGGRESLCY